MRKLSRSLLAATVGERIRQFREERGWDIRGLAARAEIQPSWLEIYEAGLRLPRVYTLYRLADILQVSVASLLEEEAPEMALADRRLLRELRRIQKLDPDDKRAVVELLESVTRGLEELRR
jgi:transcriptional regulator with XRE-family HTH domain